MLRKKNLVERRLAEAEARAKKLSTPSLFEWVDQCIYVYGKAMKEAQEAGELEKTLVLLEESKLAAVVMHEIALELLSRFDNR